MQGTAAGLGLERSIELSGLPEVAQLRRVGGMLHSRGWSLATSSNYSVVLGRDPLRLLLTASGKDKGRLGADDFVMVDERGSSITSTENKPSAETLLHVVAARRPGVGAVLHTHSTWGTILSDRFASSGGFTVRGYEMIKGLAGVTTHEHSLNVEVFENTQHIPALAEQVAKRFHDPKEPLRHGYLIRRHGLYTWGRDLEEAVRHIETFEFLFEVVGRSLTMPGYVPEGVSPLDSRARDS